MERWGVPDRPAQPPRRAASSSPRPTSFTAALPSPGFSAAFQALTGRKLRELGGRWLHRPQRERQAEAARRATTEMANRIERQTGRRPADSTIRRSARTNRTPRGLDTSISNRQTRIDAAGGVKALSQLLGVSQYAVRRWRDQGRPLVPGALTIVADVEGVLVVNGEEYPRTMSVTIDIYPPAADDVRIAYSLSDLDYIAELLGPEIAEQVDWAGEADREFTVTEITDITLH